MSEKARERERKSEYEEEEEVGVEEEEEEEETTKKPSRSWFQALYRTVSPVCVWQPRPRVDSRVPPALGAAITVTKKPPFTLPPRPFLRVPSRFSPLPSRWFCEESRDASETRILSLVLFKSKSLGKMAALLGDLI